MQKTVFLSDFYLTYISLLIVTILIKLQFEWISAILFLYDESHCWKSYKVSNWLWTQHFLQFSVSVNIKFFVFFNNSNIKNVLRTHSLCTFINQLFKFSINLSFKQLLFYQICNLTWSSFFIWSEIVTISALTILKNQLSNKQLMFWWVLNDTLIKV